MTASSGPIRLDVGADEAGAEAPVKRVSRVTLLFLGVGTGEVSFENNLSVFDTVPLAAVVRGRLALRCCERIGEEASTDDAALTSLDLTLIKAGCCIWDRGRSKSHGYGSPSQTKIISLEGEKVDSAWRLKSRERSTLCS